MSQQGVTFLEVIVVIAILMITTSLVSPSIGDWRQKRALESDFHAVLSQIDYLKTRVRTINGTATLICQSSTGAGSKLTYQISSAPQNGLVTVGNNFSSNLLEDPSAKDPAFNILSGQSQIISTICTGLRGVFISTGQSGLEGSGGAIDIEIDPVANKSKFGAYRILLNQSTGFIQKFKLNTVTSSWVELD
jgi:type II secretory pathway pseudopilin PulG